MDIIMQLKNCKALSIGLGGTLITLTLNMIGYLALKHPVALPFHDQWWSSWFPLYVVWFIFLLIGAANHSLSKSEKE